MTIRQVAALLYATVSVGVVAFQMGLAAGMPWGAYAIGGAFPGSFPPALRVAVAAGAVALHIHPRALDGKETLPS